MDKPSSYSEQVQLLVRVLPIAAEAECFALKGGTAITERLSNTTVQHSRMGRTRLALIEQINRSLTREDKEFLISVKQGHPDWNHLGVSHL